MASFRSELQSIREDFVRFLAKGGRCPTDSRGFPAYVEAMLLKVVTSCCVGPESREEVERELGPLVTHPDDRLPNTCPSELRAKIHEAITRFPGEDYLGICYESGLDHVTNLKAGLHRSAVNRGRWSSGSFYTPVFIVDYIVSRAFGRFMKRRNTLRVADLSAGSGAFLFSFLRMADQNGVRVAPAMAIDVDAAALAILRANAILARVEGRIEAMRSDALAVDERNLGQFDCVIGNPPYRRIQGLAGANIPTREYRERFQTAAGNFDIYQLFVEQGLRLLRDDGCLAYIIPQKWLAANYAVELRRMLAGFPYLELTTFGIHRVFEANVATCVLVVGKGDRMPSPLVHFDLARSASVQRACQNIVDGTMGPSRHVSRRALGEGPWILTDRNELDLLMRLRTGARLLGDIAQRVYQGLVTSGDRLFLFRPVRLDGDYVTIYSPFRRAHYEIERGLVRPILRMTEIRRFQLRYSNRFIIFPYEELSAPSRILNEEEVRQRFPGGWRYLVDHRSELESRESGKGKTASWFGYLYPKSIADQGKPKVLVAGLTSRAHVAYDENGQYYFLGRGDGGYGIVLSPTSGVGAYSLAAILNSTLIDWFHHRTAARLESGNYSYGARFLKPLPILPATFDSAVLNRLDVLGREAHTATGFQAARLEELIDDAVFELFDVGTAERQLVRDKYAESADARARTPVSNMELEGASRP